MSGKRPKGDYEIGYGRPPVATRFKPGGVGNPKGRPRKKKTLGELLNKALTTRVRIEENGRAKTMTAEEVVMNRLVHAAAHGDHRAARTVLALMERHRDSQETSLDPTEHDAEDRRIIEDYLASLKLPSSTVNTGDITAEPISDTTEPAGTGPDAKKSNEGSS